MKPFDLKEALSGKPVCTRSGKPVTQLTRFDENSHKYKVYGVLEGLIQCWTDKGIFNINSNDEADENGLMMATVTKTGWIARYVKDDNHFINGIIFDSLQQVKEVCKNAVSYHEITWEE